MRRGRRRPLHSPEWLARQYLRLRGFHPPRSRRYRPGGGNKVKKVQRIRENRDLPQGLRTSGGSHALWHNPYLSERTQRGQNSKFISLSLPDREARCCRRDTRDVLPATRTPHGIPGKRSTSKDQHLKNELTRHLAAHTDVRKEHENEHHC